MKRTDDAPPGTECGCRRVESTAYRVRDVNGGGTWEIDSDEATGECQRDAAYRVTMPNGSRFDVCGQHYHMLFVGETEAVRADMTRLQSSTTIV